jgi:hypothetical protein
MDSDIDRFDQFTALFGEHFKDYVVMARDAQNRLVWKSSDKTWAVGAMNRYMNSLDEWDRDDERQKKDNRGD